MLTGRIMGLDIGNNTIGVAVSDMLGMTAQGITTIKRTSKKNDLEALKDIIAKNNVNLIVAGLPKNMNGTIGPQAEKVQKFCELLTSELNIKVEFWDERLTTVSAEKMLISGDVRRKDRKKVIDKVAAVFILQNYLDYKKF